MKADNAHERSGFFRWHSFLICLLLAGFTLVAYLQVWEFDFVRLDDHVYTFENEQIQNGFTLDNISWALTAQVAANWHPLTLLSHMLDFQLFGLNAGYHHLTNLFFHIANTLLLFFVLRRMTGDLWPCVFVAAMFALHPLHVESVAWVSERKDVLSAFFWMLTMYAYIRYTERPGIALYLTVLVFFVLGLMSKPMLVTLPFVLLLLDYWPLRRLQFRGADQISIQPGTTLTHIILEKVPLLALSSASCIVTYHFQQVGGALRSFERYPLYERAANAFAAYIGYIIKTLWPFKLSPFYPYPDSFPFWKMFCSVILLACITYFAVRSIKHHPFFAVGWLWYMGTLVPVIGLVQVGSQAMADRYTYIPLIGIFILIAWGVPDFLRKIRYKKIFLSILFLAPVLILIPFTWIQVQHWKNGIDLFQHALDVTADNYLAHNNLASTLLKQGKIEEAIEHFSKALKINPNIPEPHCGLGLAFGMQGDIDREISHLSDALKIDPWEKENHMALGAAFFKKGNIEKGIHHLNKALMIDPDIAKAHLMLGNIFMKQGRDEEALKHYSEVLRIAPASAWAHNNTGVILAGKGRINEALNHFSGAISIKPDYVDPYINSARILWQQGNLKAAISNYSKAADLKPDSHEVLRNLEKIHLMVGNKLAEEGAYTEAIAHFQNTLQINNNSAEAHTNLGYALLVLGKQDEAIKHCLEAIRIDPEKSINAFYNLACIYAKKGNVKESVRWLKTSIEKGFNDWDALKTDEDLKNIRTTGYFIEIINKNP